MRVALVVEYQGTDYSGWQVQPNGDSVQARLEDAVHSITGERVRVHGSGRTDAGVHALGQVAHFDTAAAIPPERFCYALNQKLPPDICVRSSRLVEETFHARYSARGKHYRYQLYNAQQRPAVVREFAMHVPQPLDVGAMCEAAGYIAGKKDFASFCAAHSAVKDTVRHVRRLDVTKQGDMIVLDVEGNGFLYNMVRIIAGTLVDVGLHKYAPGALPGILQQRDRNAAGPTAKACGLFLMEVFY